MFTPIHQSLGLEPGDLSIDIIEQAVKNGVRESASLDWKAKFYDNRRQGWRDEAAKDIAAMANSGGGWIVFGVEEESETSAASKIKPIEWNSGEQQRILQVAYARVGPPVLGLEFFPFSVDGGYVVMMRVPDSREAPHFARKGDDAFVAPRRNGPHTAFMSDREIERGFRERFQHHDDDERMLQKLYEQTGKSLDSETGVRIAIAAIPCEPATAMPRLTESETHGFINLEVCPELVYQNSTELLTWSRGDVRKGLRQWIIRNCNGDRMLYRKFLCDDGTLASVYRLGDLSNCENDQRTFPVGQYNHCLSAHIESAIIDFFSLLRTYAVARQINSGYRVRVGLVSVSSEPIYIRAKDHFKFLLDVEYSDPITSFQPVTVHIDPLSSFGVLLPKLNDLARDIINQGGIKNLKVMAKPGDHETLN